MMVIEFSKRKICLGLMVVVAALHVASAAGAIAVHVFGARRSAPIVLTAVDSEWNIPAWFSSMLLAMIGVAMVLVGGHKARARERHAWSWRSLGAIFVALSIDEAVGLHERLIRPLRELLGTGGIFHFAWVIPGIIFAAAVGLVYLRFLLELPRRTRWLFVVAAALYLGGALGMEMVDGAYASVHGENNLGYRALTAVEELLEMAGMIVMVYALLDYVGRQSDTVQVRVLVERGLVQEWRIAPRPGNPGMKKADDDYRASAEVAVAESGAGAVAGVGAGAGAGAGAAGAVGPRV